MSILEYTNGKGMSIARSLDPNEGFEEMVTLGILPSDSCMELQIDAVRRLRALLNHPDVVYLLDTPLATMIQTNPRIAHDPRIRHARARLAAGELPACSALAAKHGRYQPSVCIVIVAPADNRSDTELPR